MRPFAPHKKPSYDCTVPDPALPREDIIELFHGASAATLSAYNKTADFVAHNPHAPLWIAAAGLGAALASYLASKYHADISQKEIQASVKASSTLTGQVLKNQGKILAKLAKLEDRLGSTTFKVNVNTSEFPVTTPVGIVIDTNLSLSAKKALSDSRKLGPEAFLKMNRFIESVWLANFKTAGVSDNLIKIASDTTLSEASKTKAIDFRFNFHLNHEDGAAQFKRTGILPPPLYPKPVTQILE